MGDLDDARKVPFLQQATALLFPIQWDEPFGIVVAEALSCGTPVIALRRASAPEIIDDGETGFLCDSAEQMVVAVGRVSSLSRRACRDAAEERFSSRRLADRYQEIYDEVIRG